MKKQTRLLLTPPSTAENVPVVQPIYQTSLFRMPSYAVAVESEYAVRPSAYYSRWGNPTVDYLERQLAVLAGHETALAFPSGMAAITITLLSLANPGDTIAVSNRLYGDTLKFVAEELQRFGFGVQYFDPRVASDLDKLLRGGSRVVYFESLSNPDLILADCMSLGSMIKQSGAVSVCDATFTPPGVLDTSELPIDIIIHSLTKYLGGHFTVHGGAVMCSAKLAKRIWHLQTLYGACMDASVSSQISNALKTLHIRVAQQSTTAAAVAKFLSGHEKIVKVIHPSLASFPQRQLAADLLSLGGGVISFSLQGGLPACIKLLESTKVIGLSVSLGGVHSCIEHAASMSHSMVSGITDVGPGSSKVPAEDLIRLSIGLEDPEDIIDDLAQALTR